MDVLRVNYFATRKNLINTYGIRGAVAPGPPNMAGRCAILRDIARYCAGMCDIVRSATLFDTVKVAINHEHDHELSKVLAKAGRLPGPGCPRVGRAA